MIDELIKTLTPQERSTLQERISTNTGQLYKFIDVLLDKPDWSQAEIENHFSINSNTYYKNLSLAKDEIFDVIKFHMRNAYDDLLLSNVLYRRGLDVYASKLRIRLEDEYTRHGWWNVLQELYKFEMMVAYTKCDVKWLEELKEKCFSNMDRLHSFNRVDRELIVQMALIEKGDMKEKDFKQYAKRLSTILAEAEEIDHPIPVFNALHCFFVLYTQYEVNLDKAKTVVKKIEQFLDKYENEGLIVYARNVALLNFMGFHIDFATGENPDVNFKKVKAALGKHGMLFDSQVWLDLCVYHFFEKEPAEFSSCYKQFSSLPLDGSLQYQADYLGCLSAFLENNRSAFYLHLNKFYSVERTRAHNNYDLYLRYLEILLLTKETDFGLASDKLEATIKFIRRNFTSFRIEIEKQHWAMLRSAMKGERVKALNKKVYRLTDLIYGELSK